MTSTHSPIPHLLCFLSTPTGPFIPLPFLSSPHFPLRFCPSPDFLLARHPPHQLGIRTEDGLMQKGNSGSSQTSPEAGFRLPPDTHPQKHSWCTVQGHTRPQKDRPEKVLPFSGDFSLSVCTDCSVSPSWWRMERSGHAAAHASGDLSLAVHSEGGAFGHPEAILLERPKMGRSRITTSFCHLIPPSVFSLHQPSFSFNTHLFGRMASDFAAFFLSPNF